MGREFTLSTRNVAMQGVGGGIVKIDSGVDGVKGAGNSGVTKGTGEVSQKTSAENGITKGEYKNLRKKTPSNEIRKMVNPDGPKVDPIYGYEVDKFEADHIVLMKEITEMDGFGRLTKEQQIEVLNLKDNFVGLGKSPNASKGAHSWADWKDILRWESSC